MAKLKPCPFCGGKGDMIINKNCTKGDPVKYHPCCHNEKCIMFTGGNWYKSEEEATKAWNNHVKNRKVTQK